MHSCLDCLDGESSPPSGDDGLFTPLLGDACSFLEEKYLVMEGLPDDGSFEGLDGFFAGVELAVEIKNGQSSKYDG